MRILIREENKTVINLWIPSGPRLIGLILRWVRNDEGKRIDSATRKKLVSTYRKIRKLHKNLVIADITSKDGTKVFIKL
jgi:hypothetical protein